VLGEFHVSERRGGELEAGSLIGVDIFKSARRWTWPGPLSARLRRCDQAPSLFIEPREPRQLGIAQQTRFHWTESVSEQGVPGKRMAGHLGDVRSTVQNLEIMRIDADRQLLMIRGSLPGSKGGNVVVSPTVR
jgi:large subunit ribosomal protein L3